MKTIFLLILFCPLMALAQGDLSETLIYQASIQQAVAAGGGGGTGDHIAFRAESHSTAANANGVTMTEPAGSAQNDILLAFCVCDIASSSLGAPAGWTVIYSGSSGASAGQDFRYNLCWIRRGSGAPSLTWTMSTSAYRECFILAFSGCVSSGTPYETSADGGITTAGNSPDCPSVTTTTAFDWAVAVGVGWAGPSPSWSTPAGYVIQTINNGSYDGVMATKKVSTPGAENPAAFGNGSALTHCWQATVALKPS